MTAVRRWRLHTWFIEGFPPFDDCAARYDPDRMKASGVFSFQATTTISLAEVHVMVFGNLEQQLHHFVEHSCIGN